MSSKNYEFQEIFSDTRDYLEGLGLPRGDLFHLPTSTRLFPDKAHFRVEVPTVNSAEGLELLLETANEHGVKINRVDQTHGIMRFSTREHQQYIETAKKWKCEVMFGIGPRAQYDTGAQKMVNTLWAHAYGYRLRGMEQMLRAVEDVRRILALGGRGFIIYDEGLLWLLNKMRADGIIPEDTKFKGSAVMGYCNPIGFKLLQDLGADSVNPQRDLELPMIAALRQGLNIPIDVHADNPPATGRFIRTYEAPEMVRVGSPIYIKTGNSAIPEHGMRITPKDAQAMAEQVVLSVEAIKKYYPKAIQSVPGESEDLAIPKEPFYVKF